MFEITVAQYSLLRSNGKEKARAAEEADLAHPH